ncbi:MAG: MASE1 domain-containing protein [Candidatus Sulfotelmatobacter sp.]
MLRSDTNTDSLFPKTSSLLVVFILTGMAAWGGILLAHAAGQIYAIWPANGLLLAVLLQARPRCWPSYLLCGFAATIAANFLTGEKPLLTAGLPLCDTIEILIAAAVLWKLCAHPFDLQRRRTLFNFVLFGVVLAPLVSAALAVLCVSSFPPGPGWLHNFYSWFVADALGIATVTPCVWALQQRNLPQTFSGWRLIRCLAPLSLLALATILTFSLDSYALLFLAFPLLLLFVLELGFSGAAVGVSVVAGIAVTFTVENHGPLMLIADHSLPNRITFLQVYIAAALATTLPFAALLEERKKLTRALRSSEALYRLLFERMGEAITLYPLSDSGVPGTFEKVNDMACYYFGYTRDELLRLGPLDLQAPHNDAGTQEVFTILQSKGSNHLERILLAKGNRPIPMEISVHLIEIDGRTYGLSILRDISKRKRMETEREQLINELRHALQEVKRLEGILPTCAYCKRIRDDKGQWHQFELYIRERSEAEFSHGICPECKDLHFGKLRDRLP